MVDGINIDGAFFLRYLFNPPAILWQGLWLTIWISIVAQIMGMIVGLLIALCMRSRHWWLRAFGRFYVWIWRGTPVLVQLVLIYTGVAAAGFYKYPDITIGFFVLTGPLQAALIALSLNEGAYMAEIFRAALGSIDKGQFDAVKALGMRPVTAMRYIILPQAARIVIPPLGNEFTLLIKGTSLLAVIGIRELFGTIQQLNAATFRTFELFVIAAIWYLVLTSIMGFVQRHIEAYYSRYDPPLSSQTKARVKMRGLISAQR
ncbi:amino acid ABC transporter permease [Cucumibacter marinus]|uniref:amino acid ABC transporter permease n=1 Tax=Cucumibacter marinus TaxID=1121252 RepID=UPI00042921BE|nr:amino acid ABC transporter permease [Cucumibacter marinus]